MDKNIATIKELAPNERRILDYIKSRSGTSSAEVAEQFKVSHQYACRVLSKMYRMDLIRLLYGKGVRRVYCFHSSKPSRVPERYIKRRVPKPKPPILPPVDRMAYDMTAQQIIELLVTWSRKHWEPKVIKSSTNLPRGLIRLGELAVESSFGSKINQSDLDIIRTDLQEFHGDLEHLLKVVRGVLAIQDLWMVKTSAIAMLNALPSKELSEILVKAKELN